MNQFFATQYYMDGIILDCNLMRYPHSGLYQYCLNVSERVNPILVRQNATGLEMYLPSCEILPFDNTCHIIEKKWHRYWKPFLSNCQDLACSFSVRPYFARC